MNKKQLIVAYFIFILSCIYVYAQSNDKNIDWDEKEAQFIEALRATQEEHSEAELHQAIGYWLLESDNQWERATVHFKKAIELDPKLYMSWYNLGLINIDSEEGYNYFKKAAEANPKFSTPYYWMAYYRCRYREDKKAIPLFKKYLEVAEAEKNPQEEGRIKGAKEVLADLLTGKEGQSLSMMRKP